MPRVKRRAPVLRERRAAPEDRGSRAKLHELLGMPPPPYDIRDEEYPYPALTAHRERIGWKPTTSWGITRTPTTDPEDPA